MKSATIYLLWGTDGEYEDRQEWVVAAFESFLDANIYREKLEIKMIQAFKRWKKIDEEYFSDEGLDHEEYKEKRVKVQKNLAKFDTYFKEAYNYPSDTVKYSVAPSTLFHIGT